MTPQRQITGFLPWRAPFMLDVIVVAMVFVLVVLAFSIYLVKYRQRYQWHKAIQLSTAGTLLLVLIAFEVDIQFIENWRQRADASPYFDAATGRGLALYALWVHLFFATTTLALWTVTIARALRNFPKPPGPNPHSASHARWGMIAALDMVLTAVTGWIFYYLAFVA